MVRHGRLGMVLASLVLGALIRPAHAGQQPPDPLWRFELSGAYASVGEDPLAGQGFTKPGGSGPEQPLTETPERFSALDLEGRLGIGPWFAGYKTMLGDAEASTVAPAGENGELFLTPTGIGHNGRLFPDFPVREEIHKERRTHEFYAGRLIHQLPHTGPKHSWGLFGFFEEGDLSYESGWTLDNVPGIAYDLRQVHSETDHQLDWSAFGGGVEWRIDLYSPPNSGTGIYLVVDGWIGYGSADYTATQLVVNPLQQQQDLFSVRDETTGATPGGAAELGVHFGRRIETWAQWEIERTFDVDQRNGDQVLGGLSNGIEMISPRHFRLGARFRF